jgi:transposase InsO family protein
MGKVRIANTLARAGLHLGVTTVRRMLQRTPEPESPLPAATAHPGVAQRTVAARYPHHVWNLDLTVAPTTAGFCVPWSPNSLFQTWPWCWWILVIFDHFSRAIVGFAVFNMQPTAQQVTGALDLAVDRVGRAPKYTVSDHGSQFRDEFRQCCARHGIKPRYGAVGHHGSIAVVERFIRTVKDEALRRILMPLRLDAMRAELLRYCEWYNIERPHMHLGGATPDEVRWATGPANRRRRVEPRARYPATGACAFPRVAVRGQPGCKLQLVVSDFEEDAKHLPVVQLKTAA